MGSIAKYARRTSDDLQFEVVVARYNEDLQWLEAVLPDATVYNKGDKMPSIHNIARIIDLPNIGRESHTYLHHIVSCYDTLADITLFTQGSRNGVSCFRTYTKLTSSQMEEIALKMDFGEMKTFGSIESGTLRPIDQWDGFDWEKDVDNILWLSQQRGDFLCADCTPAQYWLETFGFEHPSSIIFTEGAFFAVRRKTVRLRPRVFYEKLLAKFTQLNHVNPEIGHFQEKFWGEIFCGST
ncbi:hypothetical protein SUNI508_06943 [Seiridium unicorne]|uniref:Uncharacterized protein n=1 Tax=Seiridium unicorne TaxID=138068 RepID=A0ABR2UZD6_9PEZI